MSCEVQGLKELIDKLETTFSEKEIQKIEQKALEPISEKIKEDMKHVSPVCDEPEIHGKDVIGIRYVKSKGYDHKPMSYPLLLKIAASPDVR